MSHDAISQPAAPPYDLVGEIRLDGGEVRGFVLDRNDVTRVFVVELRVDDWPVKLARADLFHHALLVDADATVRNAPWHGFVFNAPDALLDTGSILEVRLANTGHRVGHPVTPGDPGRQETGAAPAGAITWSGGLRFEGWIADEADVEVRCLIDEEIVARVRPSGWMFVASGDRSKPRSRLDFHLPDRFADGRVRTLSVIDVEGVDLVGSPVAFFAFADGLLRFLEGAAEIESERLRAEAADELVPQSLPFAKVGTWAARFPLCFSEIVKSEIAVALIGDADSEKTLASLGPCDWPWVAGVIPGDARTGVFDARAFEEFLSELDDTADLVIVALSGTLFTIDALAAFAAAFGPDVDLVHCDIVCRDAQGAMIPVAFAAFDYERLLEQGYAAFCFAMHKRAVLAALTRNGDASVFRLCNSVLDGSGTASVHHIPAFLAVRPPVDVGLAGSALRGATEAHLASRDLGARVSERLGLLFPAVHVRRFATAEPIEVVVSAGFGGLDALRASVDNLLSLPSSHRLDVVVSMPDDPETRRHAGEFGGGRVRVVLGGASAGHAQIFDAGVRSCTRPFVALLQAGTILPDAVWFEDLVTRCGEADIAAAGGALLDADGHVRNAGFVLSPKEGVLAIAKGCGRDDPGYADLLRIACARSALAPEAMLVRRDNYLEVGGFQTAIFPHFFFATDFALRLHARRKRLIVSPHVYAIAPGQDVARPISNLMRQAAFDRELDALRLRWGAVLADDPLYGPSLALNGTPFGALAWPPRRRSARTQML